MKKMIAVALSAVILLSLAACGTEAAEPIPEPAEPEERVVVTNPVHEATAESVLQELGITMNVPEEAESVAYAIIDGEPALAQVTFTCDGTEYCYRMKSAVETEDISGMFFTWNTTEETTVDYCPATLSYNDGAEGILNWFDVVPGMMYSLSVSTGANAGLLQSMAMKLFTPLQGDAEGDPEAASLLGDEFDAVLTRISTDLHPGTAGCSLTAASFAGELCDLFTATQPNSASVLLSATTFAGTVADGVTFNQQLGMVCAAVPEILGENGAAMLDSCGYTPTEEWDAEALTTCLAELTAYMDNVAAYTDILNAYTQAKTENWDGQKLVDEGMNLMAKDSTLGYQIVDLDKDGVYELMIACMDEDNDFTYALVLDLYTLDENGEVKTVFQSGERSRYYYAGEDLFAYHGSGSAFDSEDNTQQYAAGEVTVHSDVTEENPYVLPSLTPLILG